MRPAQLLHRHIASQPGKHDLELLLRRKRPVLPLLAQPDLLLLVERPILRGPPDAIAAPPRPYGPRLHANRASNKPQAGKCLPATGVQATRELECPRFGGQLSAWSALSGWAGRMLRYAKGIEFQEAVPAGVPA